ncbi:DUF1450 domain-containing protein [Effusibacillus pohliae]|uniref:DUF1450 domain-containing protein n=1 Tax=Effusibacillus pohliae TaxID=232270 RepID=UPI0003673A05|nr:DUF1450 domain-containing protein [Effusibacillus pohliae]
MAIRKLEYCFSNLQNNGTGLVFDTIAREFPHIEQRRWACLGNCSECFKKPFVIADDREIVAASTPPELLDKLRNAIETPIG